MTRNSGERQLELDLDRTIRNYIFNDVVLRVTAKEASWKWAPIGEQAPSVIAPFGAHTASFVALSRAL
jgi:hypothetical protein